MTRLRPPSWLALVALLGGLGFGCSKSGTFVILDFKAGASTPKGIRSIDLDLTLAGHSAMTTFTGPTGSDISLPTSATLEIGSGSGVLTLTARARGQAGALLDMGTGAGTITSGSTTHITVQFGAPATDGGTPDGGSPDTGGSGGGGGGGGGADGAAGSAGTGATDGPMGETSEPDGGPTPPQLATDKDKYDFGTQVTTTTGAGVGTTTITVRNAGGQKTGALIVGVIDAVTFPTSADTCSGMSLDPGATCTVAVKFMPGTSGMKSSTLQVGASPGGMAVVRLTGTAVDPGALTLAPDHGTYDPLPQGQLSAETVFTIKNTGGAATTALTIGLSGTNAGEFKVSTDNCTGKTLDASATCTVGVKFSPTVVGIAGMEGAVLSVAATTGGTATANLSGTALGPAVLTVVPTDQDFLMVVQGMTSQEYFFMVTNKGGVASGALAAGIAPVGEFAITTNTCDGMTLAPNATCKVGIKMTPAGTGARNATLAVRGSPGGTAVATLRGTGLAPGMIVLAPQPKMYGVVDVGAPSSVPFTVTNTGGSPTTAIALQLTGDVTFTITNDQCTGMTLAPMGACMFSAVFTPTTFGPRGSSLSASAATGGTSVSALTGTGRDFVALTVTKNGTGGGTVAASGLSCANTTCMGSYPRTDPAAFQVVSLTAAPDAFSTFTGWTGAGCTGTGTCQVTMNMAQAVTATFAVKQVNITATNISVSGQTGTIVTDDGAFTCAAGTCGPTKHNAQATIGIVAKPAGGSNFIAWSNGPCKGVNPTCNVPLTGDLDVTATFGPPNYMFVTSTTVIPGRLGGIAGGDAECVARATAAGLPGTYRAWLSDVEGGVAINAIDHVGDKGGWVRTDGRPFTPSGSGINKGVIYYPPRVDEAGNDLGPKRIPVVTGSTGSGMNFGVQCGGYMQTAGSAYIGLAAAGSFYWSYNELDSQGCQDSLHLYCFRTDLSATVTITTLTPAHHLFISDLAVKPVGGLAGLDAECIADAKAAGLANFTTYVALLATSTKPALSRINATTGPWKRFDEVVVAATTADLGIGNLIAPIDVAADGVTYKNPSVWTGAVDPMTAGDATCTDWTSPANTVRGRYGYPNAASTPDWFSSGQVTCDQAGMYVICAEP
jgi:hypothetical protein